MESKESIYEKVTNQIIASLENGVAPWRAGYNNKTSSFPRNPFSPKRANGMPYTGINILILACAALDNPHHLSSYYLTFKQALDLGGAVRKGEKAAATIIYSAPQVKEDKDTGEKTSYHLTKGYAVFNASQCDNLPASYYTKAETAQPSLEGVNMCPKRDAQLRKTLIAINHGLAANQSPHYKPTTDSIHLPHPSTYTDINRYYSTAYHELAHATGHASRLNRDTLANYSKADNRAKEELTAELAAAFLCAQLNINNEPRADHAEYIGAWLKALKNDKKHIFCAAAAAQKASDWLLERMLAAPQAKENSQKAQHGLFSFAA